MYYLLHVFTFVVYYSFYTVLYNYWQNTRGLTSIHTFLTYSLLVHMPGSTLTSNRLYACLAPISAHFILLTLLNWVHTSYTEAIAAVSFYLRTFNPICISFLLGSILTCLPVVGFRTFVGSSYLFLLWVSYPRASWKLTLSQALSILSV